MSQETPSAAYPFESRFVDVLGSRLHYVEEGTGDPILLLHGNPTSSYLWRNILPIVARQGRAIAVDLIGMGRSDKPALGYRFADHVSYIDGFIEALDLQNITFVVHDWGSALGFHYARRHPDRVRALAFLEAIIAPVPSWDAFPSDFRPMFEAFRHPEKGRALIIDQNAFIEQALPAATIRDLTDEEMNAYREPFLEPASREPLFRFPNEIPIEGQPKDVHDAVIAYNSWLQETEIPKLLLYAEPGGIVRPELVEWCRGALPNLETVHLGKGVHYLQEDHPRAIGEAVASWLKGLRTP